MSKNSIETIDEKRPENARTDTPPTEGYSVEVDGRLKAQFSDRESAFESGIDLKKRFPFLQVRIYDAEHRTRTPIDHPKPNEAGS